MYNFYKSLLLASTSRIVVGAVVIQSSPISFYLVWSGSRQQTGSFSSFCTGLQRVPAGIPRIFTVQPWFRRLIWSLFWANRQQPVSFSNGGKLEGLTHHPPGLGPDIVAQLPLQVAVSISAASWTRRHAGSLWSARQVQLLVCSVSWSVCPHTDVDTIFVNDDESVDEEFRQNKVSMQSCESGPGQSGRVNGADQRSAAVLCRAWGPRMPRRSASSFSLLCFSLYMKTHIWKSLEFV